MMAERMIRTHGWDVLFYFYLGPEDLGDVMDGMRWVDAPRGIVSTVTDKILARRLNEGFTYSNPRLRRTVFAIGDTSSGPEVLDSTVHEIIHIVQHIAQKDGLDPFGEPVAYLGGHISRAISDIVCELSCPHCNA